MSSFPRTFAAGCRAAFPIVLAYVPAAFAFGAAASGTGFAPMETTALSAIMFSGANQVFFLSAIASDIPLAFIVGLCALASLRHLLYGLALRDRVGGSTQERLVFAHCLTDEVFAVAATVSEKSDDRPAGRWLLGLAVTALLSWVAGSAAGAAAGETIRALDPELANALDFALPALFLGLVWASASRAMMVPMLLAGAIAAAFVILGTPELAIPAGVLAVFSARRTNRG